MDTDDENIFDEEIEVILRPPLSRLKKKPVVPEVRPEVLPVLSLSSEEVERKPLSRLKKKTVVSRNRERIKPSFAEKKGNIVGRYEMSKPDIPEEELYVETSEDSYSAELSPSTRREMNLQNRDYLLYLALEMLNKNAWQIFINAPIIRKKFGPVLIVLESCGGGFNKTDNMKLWNIAWAGNLIVRPLDASLTKVKCVSCAYDRHVSHALYEKNDDGLELLGYIGPSCYNLRFSKILDLIDTTKYLAKVMVDNEYDSQSPEFKYFIDDAIERRIKEIIKAPKKMAEAIHRK